MSIEGITAFVFLVAGVSMHRLLPDAWSVALLLNLVSVGFFFGAGRRRSVTHAA